MEVTLDLSDDEVIIFNQILVVAEGNYHVCPESLACDDDNYDNLKKAADSLFRKFREVGIG